MSSLHRILLAGAVVALTSSPTFAGGLGVGGLRGDAGTVTTLPPGSNLLDATSLVTSTGYAFSNDSGSLAGLTGNSDAPTTLDLAHVGDFVLAQAASTFSFNATTVLSDTTSGTDGNATREIILQGNVTRGANTGMGLMTLTYAETSIGGISSSFSLDVVPEPNSIILAGIGLAAAGGLGLRKRHAK